MIVGAVSRECVEAHATRNRNVDTLRTSMQERWAPTLVVLRKAQLFAQVASRSCHDGSTWIPDF